MYAPPQESDRYHLYCFAAPISAKTFPCRSHDHQHQNQVNDPALAQYFQKLIVRVYSPEKMPLSCLITFNPITEYERPSDKLQSRLPYQHSSRKRTPLPQYPVNEPPQVILQLHYNYQNKENKMN